MRRSTDKVLTTHTGGIGRAEALTVQLFAPESNGGSDLGASLRSAVDEVVRHQVETGIDVVNDGNQAISTTTRWAAEHLAGVELHVGPSSNGHRSALPANGDRYQADWDFPEFFDRAYPAGDTLNEVAACTAAVGWAGEQRLRRDLENLLSARSAAGAGETFASVPSPGTLARVISEQFYSSRQELEEAVADALRAAYAAIAESELLLNIELAWRGTRSRLLRDVELLNHALGSVLADSVRVWVSFGADEGPHHRDPELRDLTDILFELKANGLALVAANGRHEADYHVWSEVTLPEGKVLMPGVIDPTSNIIEHPRTVAERIVRYARLVGRENVIASVDSSFEPTPGLYQEFRVTRDVMWAKFRSLVQGADMATQELWPG